MLAMRFSELPLQRGSGVKVRPLVNSWPLHPDRPHLPWRVPTVGVAT